MLQPAPRLDLLEFVTPPQGAELIRYSYYSRKEVSSGVWPSELQFFADQAGVAGATIRDTNMTKGSAIGNPRRFLAQFINLDVYCIDQAEAIAPDVSANLAELLRQLVLKIECLDKEYLTVPAWIVPAGGGLTGFSGDTVDIVANGVADKRNAYPIELNLEREASFSVKLLSPVAGGVTTTKDLIAEIVLTGLLLRPKQ